MGLGKTIEALALILSDHDDKYPYKPPAQPPAAAARIAAADAAFKEDCRRRGLVQSRATLIIAPVSLVRLLSSPHCMVCMLRAPLNHAPASCHPTYPHFPT